MLVRDLERLHSEPCEFEHRNIMAYPMMIFGMAQVISVARKVCREQRAMCKVCLRHLPKAQPRVRLP